MIINGNENNTIKYTCSCGIMGECVVKPHDGNCASIIDIVCPHCGDSERVKLIQYDSDEARERLLKKDIDLSWSAIIDNRFRN